MGMLYQNQEDGAREGAEYKKNIIKVTEHLTILLPEVRL
jgi:hypothetical protein